MKTGLDLSCALNDFNHNGKTEISYEQILYANEQLQTIIEAIPDAIIFKNAEGRWLFANELAKQLFHLHTISWQGKTEIELKKLQPIYRTSYENCLRDDENVWRSGAPTLFEETVIDDDGNQRIFVVRKIPLFTPENQRKCMIIIGQDITSHKQATERVHRLAYYDPLTELPNRRLMMVRLEQAMADSSSQGCPGALLFIDLDRFKLLNDTAGHATGDLLLKKVAARMKTCVHEEDTVARLGGDEFVIICSSHAHHTIDAITRAQLLSYHILELFKVPFQLDHHNYYSSPSIGVTPFMGREVPVTELLKRADMAMYRAKAEGRNTVRLFDQNMQATLDMHNLIGKALYRVISHKQLHLHYQVQVDDERHAIGAEALLRWDSPEMGWIPPNQFIPVAEESELIITMGDWVLETACEQLRSWESNDLTRSLKLAVNVSSRQFHQPQFVQRVAQIVKNSSIDPTLLKLELTEGLILTNIEDSIKKVLAIKSLGISLSLDDFGSGYSSVFYLKKLPLDQLKIDQTFVQNVLIDQNDAALVKSIIDLAHNFNLEIIAEGVETEEQLAFLNNHGCHAHQGYLFSEPVAEESFVQLSYLKKNFPNRP